LSEGRLRLFRRRSRDEHQRIAERSGRYRLAKLERAGGRIALNLHDWDAVDSQRTKTSGIENEKVGCAGRRAADAKQISRRRVAAQPRVHRHTAAQPNPISVYDELIADRGAA